MRKNKKKVRGEHPKEKKAELIGQSYLIVDTFEMVDIEKLKKLCGEIGLPVKRFRGLTYGGLISIGFPLSNLGDLISVRLEILKIIKYCIKGEEKKEEIKNTILKSRIPDLLISTLQLTYKHLKQKKISKEKVYDFLKGRYEGILNDFVIRGIANMMVCSKRNEIMENYSSLLDFLLKEYYLEFLTVDQMGMSSLFVIFPKEEYINMEDKALDYEKIGIPEIRDLEFKWVEQYIPQSHSRAQLMISKKRNDIVICPFRNVPSLYLISFLIYICQATSGLQMINFILEKQRKLLELEVSRWGMDIEEIKATLVNYSVKQTKKEIERIRSAIILLKENYTCFIEPIEITLKEFSFRKQQLNRKITDDLFKKHRIFGAEGYTPSDWLIRYFPGTLIGKLRAKVNSIKKFYKNLMGEYNELITYMIRLINAKEDQNFEAVERTAGLISYTLGRFFRGLLDG